MHRTIKHSSTYSNLIQPFLPHYLSPIYPQHHLPISSPSLLFLPRLSLLRRTLLPRDPTVGDGAVSLGSRRRTQASGGLHGAAGRLLLGPGRPPPSAVPPGRSCGQAGAHHRRVFCRSSGIHHVCLCSCVCVNVCVFLWFIHTGSHEAEDVQRGED